jgi:hypothetical protein
MVAKLSDAAPTPETVAQVLSPLKNVVPSLVPEVPSLRTGTVPEPRFDALRAVRLMPLAAGNVAGKRASGTVPLVSCVALSAVKLAPDVAGSAAGNRASGTVPEARLDAFKLPENDAAVILPLSSIVAVLFCMIVPVAS